METNLKMSSAIRDRNQVQAQRHIAKRRRHKSPCEIARAKAFGLMALLDAIHLSSRK